MNSTLALTLCVMLFLVLVYLTVREVRRRDKAQEGILAAMNNASPARLVVLGLMVLIAVLSGAQRI